MKKMLKISMGITLFILIFLPLSSIAQDQESYTYQLTQSVSSYRFWTTTPGVRVFKDDAVPSETGSEVKVYAAKNEFEPFQLVVNPAASGDITVNIGDFGSGIITEIYQVKYVNISTATDYLGRTGDYPDPLWPVEKGASASLTANENTSFWFSLHVPEAAPSGDYTANVQIGEISIPVKLHVFNFAVPDELHVKSQMNFSHSAILEKYSVSGTGDEYWMYIDKIKQFFIDHRLTPKSVLWSGGLTSSGAGPYIDYDCNGTLTDNDGIWGFEKPAERYLNGTGLMDGKFTTPFNEGSGFPSFMAATFKNNDSSADQRPSTFCDLTRAEGDWYTADNPNSPYNQKWFEYITSLENYLKNTAYLDKAYYYFANEPQDQDDYDAVAWYSKYLKQAAPNLKLMVSENPREEIFNNTNYTKSGQIDIWLPVLNKYDPVISHDREKNHGEETWIYFLHGTRPPYFNPITLDHPGIESKFTGWFMWKYRVRGIAYYSMNNWSLNPWTEPNPDYTNHNGDLFMLYPPSESNTPIAYASNNHRLVPSIRFELMRDSLEDYEYLYVLNNGARPEVDTANPGDAQADKIISGLTSYTRDTEFMYNLRRVIGLKNGNEIEAIPDINPPPTHPRAEGEPGNYYINFQDPAGEPSANPLIINDKEYMKIGWNEYDDNLGYGWYGDMANIKYQYLTEGANELQKSVIYDDWGREKVFDFDLPNGTYNVTVSVGWQGRTYSRNKIDIEGLSFVNDEASNPYIVRTKEVYISDNKLTMAMGIFDEYTMLNYLEIEAVIPPKIPVPEFSADTTAGTAPLTATFTDQSTNNPTAWEWDFDNDGTIDSTEQNPVYSYESPGLYSVKLTAGNVDGSDSIIKTDFITVSEQDTTPPSPPAFKNSDPAPQTWSNSSTVTVSLNPGQDEGSGVAGYFYIWDTNAETVPDNTFETTELTLASPELSEGNTHYLHVCTVDNAGNKSSPLHSGPFYIDMTAPENPLIDPSVNEEKGNNTTPTLIWQAVSDAHHYILQYSRSSEFASFTEISGISAISKTIDEPLSSDGIWYWRVKAVDEAGNESGWSLSTYHLLTGESPVIGIVSPLQCLGNQTEALIIAEGVTGINPVSRVWGTVRGPDAMGLPDSELPIFELISTGSNRYEGTYSDFNTSGEYNIAIYAKDSENAVSNSILTKIIKGPFEKGDLNIDGLVGLDDAISALKILTGNDSPGLPCSNYMDSGIDVNGNSLGLEEVVYILQQVSGI